MDYDDMTTFLDNYIFRDNKACCNDLEDTVNYLEDRIEYLEFNFMIFILSTVIMCGIAWIILNKQGIDNTKVNILYNRVMILEKNASAPEKIKKV